MIGPGLSLDQAPPISVPLRFFLTAPLFGIGAGLLLALQPVLIQDRWTPGMLAATHLFLLGFVVMVMLGALHQLLPVAAGAPMRAPRIVGGIVHVAWSLGTALLAAGFLTGSRLAMAVAAALLVLGATTFLVGASRLVTTKARGETRRAILLALFGFGTAIALGTILASGHAGLTGLRRFPLTDLHAGWALVGWIAALIMGVSLQLVPMLFTTPPHRLFLRRMIPLLPVLLVAWSLVPEGSLRTFLHVGIAILLATFAGSSLLQLAQRRRSVPDASVRLLRFAHVALIVAAAIVILLALGGFRDPGPRPALVAALLFAVAFASSVVVALLLKIVPFLTWFHLQAEAGRRLSLSLPAMDVPTMKDVLPDARARLVVRLHAAACVAIVAAPMLPAWAARGAGALLAASCAALGLVLASAALKHRATCGR